MRLHTNSETLPRKFIAEQWDNLYIYKEAASSIRQLQWHFALCVHLAMFSDKLCGFRALKGFFVRPCAFLNAFLGLPCGAICRPFGSVCLLLVKAVG